MRRVTLAQLFGAATVAVAMVVAVAFLVFVERSRASILKSSRASLERDLFTRILDDSHLEEVTFTSARLIGYDANGEAQLAPEHRWQLSVYRGSTGAIITKSARQEHEGEGPYEVTLRDRGTDTSLATAPFTPAGRAPDPTAHLTFSVIVSKDVHGKAAWSDLHWSEIDRAATSRERRVVVSVQKAVADAAGLFIGVVRVGLVTTELDAIARAQPSAGEARTCNASRCSRRLRTAGRRGSWRASIQPIAW